MSLKKDKQFMLLALKEAQVAASYDEVPVGAVVVKADKIISRGYNQVERLKDPTAHAEMLAVTSACSALSSKWLNDCTVYVTLEPCAMCAGMFILARVKRLVFGAFEPKTGSFGSKLDITAIKLNHKLKVTSGVLGKECAKIISDFFKQKRQINK